MEFIYDPPEIGCVLALMGRPFGGSTILDNSPYGNNGTITGATWERLGGGLWVLDFDGSDDIVGCGTNPILDSADMSVELWLKPDKLDARNGVVEWYEGANDTWEFWIGNDGIIVMSVRYGGNVISDLTSNSAFTGAWQHVVLVWDSGSWRKWYIDGSETRSTDLVTVKTAIAGTFTLAQTHIATAVEYDGMMALPRAYNRTLSALEIQNHYQQEKHLFGVW